VVWETSPKLNQTVLFIYISHPKPPHPTNFQNQIHLDFIIISAKPYSNPRFHPATASGGCSVNALLTRFTVRANRAHKSINKHLGTYLPLVDSVTSVVLQKGAWVGGHVLKKRSHHSFLVCTNLLQYNMDQWCRYRIYLSLKTKASSSRISVFLTLVEG